MWFLDNAWLIPTLPAASFLVILFFGKRFPRGGSEVGVLAVAGSFVLSCGAALQWIDRTESVSATGEHSGSVEPVINSVIWWQSGNVEFSIGTMVDGLAAVMVFTVSLVSLAVHVYSTDYMAGDRRFTQYFAFLSLFTASMLLLVLSENMIQLLIGWELVGLCSYVLIGHWWEEKENTDAALKAFLTNRVGDTGLIIGIIMLFWAFGTFDIFEINSAAVTGETSHTLLLVASVALFWAVTSKSGQFPLHTWLPDAMAGPTPVSALIHAATMVVAGVFLVARLYPVFFEGFSIGSGAINYMAFIGAFTTIIGAVLAFVQRDIKRVLAYSTISQLGYMVMALGVGAWTAALFHLFTHAFFKASLFLGAGSVSHGVGGSFDMVDDMGGLRRFMPVTFGAFALSSLALAGIPPLSGFWSKDEILAGAASGQQQEYQLMLVMGAVTALLTAAYMTRCIWLTFFGEYRGAGEPHESRAGLTVPIWVLTGLATLVGVINLPAELVPDALEHKFQDWVEPTVAFPAVEHAEFTFGLAAISVALALAGATIAYQYYWRGRGPHGLTERSSVARVGYRFLDNRYYLDHLYTDVVFGSIKGAIARAAAWFDRSVIDRSVDAAGTTSRRVGVLLYDRVDQAGIDGLVNASGGAAEGSGQFLRRIQTGKVQQYGALLFGAAAVLAAVFVFVV